jgi:hypothetical protein
MESPSEPNTNYANTHFLHRFITPKIVLGGYGSDSHCFELLATSVLSTSIGYLHYCRINALSIQRILIFVCTAMLANLNSQ